MAPKRLPDIMLRYNRYDVNYVFVKGGELNLADTLNRAHLDSMEGNQDNRVRIINVYAFGDIPDERLNEIRTLTSRDMFLQTVMKLILEGWPENKRDIPTCALPYFDLCDTLSVVHGILVTGEAVVIPSERRSTIKRRPHCSHVVRDDMLRRARGVVFWPGMASDIKPLADSCDSIWRLAVMFYLVYDQGPFLNT